MNNMLFATEVYEIIGCCMEVHRILGHGFSEIIYKDALEWEFLDGNITYEREKEFLVKYKTHILNRRFFADFFMMNKIIVEIKSNREGLANENISQTLNYLKASGSRLGVLINFGKPSLEYKRLIF